MHVVFFTFTSHVYNFALYINTQETPIFLVYDPSGPGHYDSAILYTDTCTTYADQKLPKPTKCSCGVNKKGAGTQTSCIFQPHYETRCMCYKLGQACTSLCRCKNCANPNGHRREEAVSGNRKRRIQKDISKSKKGMWRVNVSSNMVRFWVHCPVWNSFFFFWTTTACHYITTL